MDETVTRVQHYLAGHGLTVEIRTFEIPVRTAQQAAQALGTAPRHIVKSLVFEADGQPLLVLCGGDRRVDTARLAALCAAQRVRPASPERTERLTGYRVGGVPPVALATPLPVFMDEGLLACDTVYAAAGTAHTLFAISPHDLRAVCGARLVVMSAG